MSDTKTELEMFAAMLERAGIDHGTRIDHDPPGTSVQVSHGDGEGKEWWITDWSFDESGRLCDVNHYPGIDG